MPITLATSYYGSNNSQRSVSRTQTWVENVEQHVMTNATTVFTRSQIYVNFVLSQCKRCELTAHERGALVNDVTVDEAAPTFETNPTHLQLIRPFTTHAHLNIYSWLIISARPLPINGHFAVGVTKYTIWHIQGIS